MGRPPCCDKDGIKKGPWTPEEDIILVSYIQQHGPGNWRAVPTNTGLLRCSKSCRLRWTNYLRPGIKRGNFTPHEEGMIIHLQALLGNKWAAIASYLPQRTDNDIKNYWNTHLKKKLNKFQFQPAAFAGSKDSFMSNAPSIMEEAAATQYSSSSSSISTNSCQTLTMRTPTSYASSTENISRLLQAWMRPSPNNSKLEKQQNIGGGGSRNEGGVFPHEDEFDSMNLSFGEETNNNDSDDNTHANNNNNPPLTFLEKWLLDETSNQVEETMDIPSMF